MNDETRTDPLLQPVGAPQTAGVVQARPDVAGQHDRGWVGVT
jgi:hypothetical protein